MSLETEMIKHYSEILTNESRLTLYDTPVVQCGLDATEAKEDPYLATASSNQVEKAIDSVYIAANAGLPIGKFLLLQSAHIQYGIMNFSTMCDYEVEDRPVTAQLAPIDSIDESLVLLDASIAAIEDAIKNAENGLTQEDA